MIKGYPVPWIPVISLKDPQFHFKTVRLPCISNITRWPVVRLTLTLTPQDTCWCQVVVNAVDGQRQQCRKRDMQRLGMWAMGIRY